MKRINRAVALVGILGLLAAVGCGPEDEVNQDDNQNQENQDNQDNQELGDSGDFLSDYDLRMTTFAFEPNTPGSTLNGIINQFITDQSYDYPIVVLIEFRDIDVVGESFRIRGGAGLKTETEEEYVWDDEFDLPEYSEGSFNEDGEFEATLPLLNFVATIDSDEEVFKTVIPIRDLEIEGTLWVNEDGEEPQVPAGELSGILLLEEAEDVRVVFAPGTEGVPLPQVFGGADTVNYDYSGDGTNDSWQLFATYTAAETTILD